MSVLAETPESLGSRLPLAEAFFRDALSSGRLAHAYLLKGRATGAMYNLALQIARAVNCPHRPAGMDAWHADSLTHLPDLTAGACGQCKDCRWISENAHPAVQTISPLTCLVDDEKSPPTMLPAEALEKLAQKSAWPTQIKTGQMEHLIYRLGISSEYTRVIILCDAEELPAALPSEIPSPCEWRSLAATEDRSFHVRPLQQSVFNVFSVNRFLKTLEEPPPRTLFFLLAENENQVLDTVVSRCQVIPCIETGGLREEAPPEAIEAFFHEFSARLRERSDVYALQTSLESFIGEQGLNTTQALGFFQSHLHRTFREAEAAGHGGEARFHAYRQAQREIENVLRMLAAKTHEAPCVLHLLLKLQMLL